MGYILLDRALFRLNMPLAAHILANLSAHCIDTPHNNQAIKIYGARLAKRYGKRDEAYRLFMEASEPPEEGVIEGSLNYIPAMLEQADLLLCFSVLVGSFILLLVPSNYRPNVKIPKYFLLISAITLPVFAFFPVLDIILFIAPRLGLLESFKIVLTTYTVGTAWDFTLLGSIVLILLIVFTRPAEKSNFAFLGLVLTFGLILTIAWSSHAGAMDPNTGIISDFLHLTAVSIWVGILLIIGWVVAISCLIITAVSGLFLMNVMVDGYTDSWMVSYGQGLLIKHLFLLPLIFYALVNSLVVNYKISKDATFNPIPLIRIEGLILFAIFLITAIFSQQSPPHGNYLTNEAVSPLFRLFHDGIIDPGLMTLSIYKKASIIITFLFSCLFVMSIYFMFMISVVIR
uniref:Copper resistance protein D domain-containing protein n=1 Tax=Batrachochytrium dendrobatidis (strain JAM81 / FGSC 10211) TaxID=684364 RepID=F4PFT9_BATDJ|eukprot:XP_006683472.1 hypothetical protein BATDEDRAFT_36321 [Batrachochytrium dendrobatidis JAM81]